MTEEVLTQTQQQEVLKYDIKDPLELNLSYMPFINNGGLFIPTPKKYSLGEPINLELCLPGKKEHLKIEGKVVWITPPNALHHVLTGIGIQFTGVNSGTIKSQIEAHLDPSIAVGGYTYGITADYQKQE